MQPSFFLTLLIAVFPAIGMLLGAGALLFALTRNNLPALRLTHFLFLGNAVLSVLVYALFCTVGNQPFGEAETLPQVLHLVLLTLTVVLGFFTLISLLSFLYAEMYPQFFLRFSLIASLLGILLILGQVVSTFADSRPLTQREHQFTETDAYVGEGPSVDQPRNH